MTRDRKRHFQSEGRLTTVQTMLCGRIDTLLDRLGVGLTRVGKFYQGCCPVHGGDNSQAVTLYHTGDTVPGYWRCYTHGCHRVFKPTIIGFVRGVLSHQRCGWRAQGDRYTAFGDAVRWCCDFLGEKFEDIEVDEAELERLRFAGEVAAFNKKPTIDGHGVTRDDVRRKTRIPCRYFVDRGWSPDTLDRYDVGLCDNPAKPFFNRAVVPLYDDAYKLAVGFTGRSVHPQCPACQLWHDPSGKCPVSQQERNASSKWRNSDGFRRESFLYNWWFARKPIETVRVTCLVEGAGEVWRLDEAGVRCGLALLSNTLTDEQQVRLEASGAMTIISLLNNDEAGNLGHADLVARMGRCCRIVRPELPVNDLGDMSSQEVGKLVLPLIEKHTRKF